MLGRLIGDLDLSRTGRRSIDLRRTGDFRGGERLGDRRRGERLRAGDRRGDRLGGERAGERRLGVLSRAGERRSDDGRRRGDER